MNGRIAPQTITTGRPQTGKSALQYKRKKAAMAIFRHWQALFFDRSNLRAATCRKKVIRLFQ